MFIAQPIDESGAPFGGAEQGLNPFLKSIPLLRTRVARLLLDAINIAPRRGETQSKFVFGTNQSSD